MKTVAVGDTVMLSAIWRDVRAAFPSAAMVLITGEDNRAVGDLFAGNAERVIVSPDAPASSAMRVRRAALDLLIDIGPWARFDAALSGLSGACTVGFRTAGQHRHGVYDVAVDHRGDIHELDNFRALAAAIGVRATSMPEIPIPARDASTHVLAGPYVVFHPWAGGYRNQVKEWPSDRWATLAHHLVSLGYAIVLSGGPNDRERSARLWNFLRDQSIESIDVAGRFQLPEFALVLRDSAAVVSVNTGIAHLAAAVGARTVSLEGPTSSARWRPIGPRAASVDTSYPGCGFLQLGWEYEGNRLDCMSGVEVSAVSKALEELLAAD
jgi:ADP-heptose:LPS heptosyltransferase